MSGSYDLDIVAQSAPASGGFTHLKAGVSINDYGYIAFVGESQNSNGQSADNIYAVNPTTGNLNQLMNPVFMYPKEGVDQLVAGTQSIFDEVQINNNGDVLARRHLNASVQIGGPVGTIATAPLTYLETWNADATNPPGLPAAQVAVGVPAGQTASAWFFLNPATAGVYPSPLPLGSPYEGLYSNSTINNLSQVNFSAIVNGAIVSGVSGNNRIASNTLGDLVGAGGISSLTIHPRLADNGFYVFTTSSGTVYAEPWLMNGGLQNLAGSSSGFSAVSEAGISDDGNVIVFAGVSTSNGMGIYVSTFSTASHSYSAPVKVFGISGDGVVDPGETWKDANSNGILDPGEDVGGLASLDLGSRVCVSRPSNPLHQSQYTIAFLGTDTSGTLGLWTTRVDVSNRGAPTANVPDVVVQQGDTINGLPGAVSSIAIHDAVNNQGQLAFWVSSSGGVLEAIVRAREVPVDVVATAGCALDTKTLQLKYEIRGRDLGLPFTVGVYRSPTKMFDPATAVPIEDPTTIPVFDNAGMLTTWEGEHTITFSLKGDILHDSSYPYLFVVADPPIRDYDGSFTESDDTNNSMRIGTLTAQQVAAVFPTSSQVVDYVNAMNDAMAEFGIFTVAQQAAFLAQMGGETGGFCLTWTEKYTTKADFQLPGVNRPPHTATGNTEQEKMEDYFNYWYGGRVGNTQPGDGYRYRGRGPIQLTGRANYQRAKDYLGVDLINQPDLLADRSQPTYGFRAAAWFWTVEKNINASVNLLQVNWSNLSSAQSQSSITQVNQAVTRLVNGGLNKLAVRRQYFAKALTVLSRM